MPKPSTRAHPTPSPERLPEAPGPGSLRPTRIDLPGADVVRIEGLFTPAEADDLLGSLRAEVLWRQETVRLFGREVRSPRLTAWYGDPGAVYTYSGLTLEPRAWLPSLETIRRRIEAVTDHAFNSVLCNLYRDGRDSMGWHSDDERELGPEPVVASVSLGGTRRFKLRHRTRREVPTATLPLDHGSLLVMAGPTQRLYRHCVTKTKRPCAPRVNLTYRFVDPSRTPPARRSHR